MQCSDKNNETPVTTKRFKVECVLFRSFNRRATVEVEATSQEEADLLMGTLFAASAEALDYEEGRFLKYFGVRWWPAEDRDYIVAVGGNDAGVLDEPLASLKRLPVWAAEFLVRRMKGETLDLSGLKGLSQEARELLASHKGEVILPDDLPLVPDPDVILTTEIAQELASGGDVDLRHFTLVEDEAAKILSRRRGPLLLTRVRELSAASAAELAKHRGGVLWLDGLKRLSPAAAAAIQQHPKLHAPPMGRLVAAVTSVAT